MNSYSKYVHQRDDGWQVWCDVRGPNGEAWRVRREMLQTWR